MQINHCTFRHSTFSGQNFPVTQKIAHAESRCSSALWFWFLLLPAAQQGWSVSPCTLDTGTLGRQPKTNSCRREAICHFLATDIWHRIILHLSAIVRQMFKLKGDYVAVWTVPLATHLSCRPMQFRIRFSAAHNLLSKFIRPPCASVKFNTQLHHTKPIKPQ